MENLRKHTFQNWANFVLIVAKSNVVITDLYRDVQSGLAVLELLKFVNKERPIPPYHNKPKTQEEKIRNHQIVFDFLVKEGIDVKVIGSKLLMNFGLIYWDSILTEKVT